MSREMRSSATVNVMTAEIIPFPSQSFDDFWRAYPKRLNNPKKAALKVWARLIKTIPPDSIIAAAAGYASYCAFLGTESAYIKQARTFLNEGDFEDWASFEVPVEHTPEDLLKRARMKMWDEAGKWMGPIHERPE